MSEEPAITVGMPVYNGAGWLRESVLSLLQQTRGDFILVISDNASTDDTPAICQELAASDGRIRVLRNARNIGVFANYNRVFEAANTPYFKWASANDLCAPRFLQACIAALEATPGAVLAAPRTILFTDDPKSGEPYTHDLDLRDSSPVTRFRRLLAEVRLNNAFNGVIRTQILRQTGLNGPFQGSDYVVLAELALRGTILCIPDLLFFRRFSAGASSSTIDEQARREFYATVGRDVFRSPSWDLHRHMLSASLRAPISLADRARCAMHVLQRLWWARAGLWREFREASRTSATS